MGDVKKYYFTGCVLMSKKKIIIATVVVLLLTAIGFILVPRVRLHMEIKKNLSRCKSCEQEHFITDFSISEENTFKFSNDYLSVEIPEGYTHEYLENLDMDMYERESWEPTYVFFDYPTDLSWSLLDPQYYEGEASLNRIGIDALRDEFEELGYGMPDSNYNALRAAILLNEDDYSFWNFDRQVVFSVLSDIKADLHKEQQIWFYEREDVRAIIRQTGGTRRFEIDVMKTDDLNIAYGMLIRDAEKEDVWKLLNTLEFH